MLKVKLNRDLRKQILRGHPWVYREALASLPKVEIAQWCQLLDKKSQFLAWGYHDPHSPLAVRVISMSKKPPQKDDFHKIFSDCFKFRLTMINSETNAYRLFNGEGDRLPGLVCDIYDKIAVIQFDGLGAYEFWDQDFIAQWLLENTPCESVLCKPRRSDDREAQWWGKTVDQSVIQIKENGVPFFVNIVDGQKTGFFLDQRDNRNYVKKISKDKKVLNLFSYSGGFSLYAGVGGAQEVSSVDLSQEALKLAEQAWKKAELSSPHKTHSEDVFEFIGKQNHKWDLVIVDPPSMTHSEKQKSKASKAYIELFAQAIKLGSQDICFSSCSSHIHFDDFFEIIEEALSLTRKKGKIHRVSGQGADHPFPHICHELRYLKFVHLKLD